MFFFFWGGGGGGGGLQNNNIYFKIEKMNKKADWKKSK